MKKTRCYSVRLECLAPISSLAYKAVCFDGSEDIIPKSQVFGQDYDVQKSEAYWIACWILEKKNIQYSTKKAGWYNPATGVVEMEFKSESMEVIEHIPEKLEVPEIVSINEELLK